MEDKRPLCEKCGCPRNWLHRHHVIPKSQGGSDDPSNILRICANCHEDAHGGLFGGPIGGNPTAHTPEAKAKRRATMRALWDDPEYRARQSAALAEGIRKRDNKALSEKLKAAWTPERKAAQAIRIKEIREKVYWNNRDGLNGDGPKRKWAARWDHCLSCGTKDTPHHSHGLCRRCFPRIHKNRKAQERREKREQEKHQADIGIIRPLS